MALIKNPTSMKGPAEVVHGWMFIGSAFNILLLGVMVAQVYMYYKQYKDDRTWIKSFVAGIFVVDLVNTTFLFIYLYRSLITFYGEPAFLMQVDWMLATGAWTTGVIACAVQLFFAWRIVVLTNNWVYGIIIGALAISGCGASMAVPAIAGRSIHVSQFFKVKPAVTVWLVCEVAADIMITTLLVWYLVSLIGHRIFKAILTLVVSLQRKHKTGFRRSDMIVDRIIRLTLQTGLITVIVASVDLFFFLADPTGTHFLLNLPLAKLYANSLMSSLNSRHGWNFSGSKCGGTVSDTQVNTTSGAQRRINTSNVKKADIAEPGAIRNHPAGVFVYVESHELSDVKTGVNSRPSVEILGDDKKWATEQSQWA